jgi:predicted nuclease with TOPRIM domain
MLGKEIAVTRGTQLERLSKLETEKAFLVDQQKELHGQQEAMNEKLDKLLTMVTQVNDKVLEVDKKIEKMEPHVTTVANAKTFWAWTGKIAAYTTAIGATGYGTWMTVKPWLVWLATGK